MSKSKANHTQESSLENAAQAGAAYEVVDRYGSAAKQHFVSYSGIDNESGQILKRGLKKTAQSSVNPNYERQNIKQQAGYAAEDKYTARQNAEKIINGEKSRYTRTDDIGKVNDPLYDFVLLDANGNVIPNSGEQMKFVGGSPKECLGLLESGKFKKYIDADAKIVVPSDYYQELISCADAQIKSLESRLDYAKSTGDDKLAKQLSQKIEQVKKLKSNLKDSGITNKEALFAREHPKLSAAKDIAKVSNRAGLEQAKYGAAIGGGISLIRNIVAVVKDEKDAKKAAVDVAKDTGTGAVTAYVTAFAGTAIKASMQNASSSAMRAISKTNAPAAIVTSSIDVSKSIARFAKGEITGSDCIVEIGEKGVGNLSAAMFAVAGQAAIPIPVVGAMVGSMVGYALSSTFYSLLIDSLKEEKLARENRQRIEQECSDAIAMIKQYRKEMNAYVERYFIHYNAIFSEAFLKMDEALSTDNINQYLEACNDITSAFGGEIQYETRDEFEILMESQKPFKL